jgi:endonuclease/exonuclease/phosphatase family metal-dependent hydrolase
MRIASFNTENLFSRARALNIRRTETIKKWLEKIGELQDLLNKDSYDKPAIFKLYQEVKSYIDVSEARGKLFKYRGRKVVGVRANGRNDWDGSIQFVREDMSEMARSTTARVIREMKPDIACLVEVEDRLTLERFYSSLVKTNTLQLPFNMCIDGRDQRGIDVGVLSRYPIKQIETHIYDKEKPSSRSFIFARDCLEITLQLSKTKDLVLLCNHFTSKLNGGGADRRLAQAKQVAKILGKYDLKKEYVVVAGDLNDVPDSASLQPLLALPDLHDVLSLQFGNDTDQRWTYFYKKKEQIDYILVSDALRKKFKQAGVERRGIFDIEKISNGTIKRFAEIKDYKDEASDHGGVWAEFNL